MAINGLTFAVGLACLLLAVYHASQGSFAMFAGDMAWVGIFVMQTPRVSQ